jgi:hypothetical protein
MNHMINIYFKQNLKSSNVHFLQRSHDQNRQQTCLHNPQNAFQLDIF